MCLSYGVSSRSGEVTTEVLERHLSVPEELRRNTLAHVYRQRLDTAHNACMMPGVIGAPIGKIESF